MRYDLLIHSGTVITVNPAFEVIPDGMVAVKDGRIASVTAIAPDRRLPQARESIDAEGGIIMPGLVNTHTHLPMSLFRGLADDLPLLTWLNEHIYPAEAAHIAPETVRLGTQLACAEMLMSGTTTCCDGYFFEDEIAAAIADSGVRAVLAQGVVDFPVPGVPDPSKNILQALAFIQKWQGVSDLISPSIFCHSAYTCSAATLQSAKAAAKAAGVLFQIHAAETKWELDHITSEHAASPIEYLDRLKILDRRTLLVHGVWLNRRDIDLIAGSGSAVSHNPESNMKLASGIAPVPALLKAGVTVGLGTDGCASNNNLDLFTEMDTAAKLHKVISQDPTAGDARCVLEMATIGAAGAIGLEGQIGSLEIGKQADVIVVQTKSPHLVPMYSPVSHMVYAANGSDVRDVVVSGHILVKNRKLLSLDLEDILTRAADFARRLGVQAP